MSVVDFIEQHMYPGLFGYIFIEELGIPLPIPGDALLLFLGIKSLDDHQAGFAMVLLITCLSTILGASILYYVARKVGRPLLFKYQRYLKYLHIAPEDIDTMEHYMMHYGTWVLIVSRLTPGLRILGTVAAGVLNVSYKSFILATLAGTVIWTSLYFWLGIFLGRRFADQIDAIFTNKIFMVLLFIVGLSLWVLLFKLLSPTLKRNRHQHTSGT